MPNWCYNELEVTGPLKSLKDFDKQFKSKHTIFSGGSTGAQTEESFLESRQGSDVGLIDYKVIERDKSPIAGALNLNHINYINKIEEVEGEYSFSNFIELTKDKFLDGWYSWSLDNWGTKWDLAHANADLYQIDEITEFSLYTFDTANSPAKPVVREMSNQYPELYFKYSYHEPGMQYAGTHMYVGGEELDSIEVDGSDDNYEMFISRMFDIGLLICKDCGQFTIDWSDEKDLGSCIYCESSNVEEFMIE